MPWYPYDRGSSNHKTRQLSKQLVMRTGALENGKSGTLSPNDKPVARIGNMALSAPSPLPLKLVHIVSAPKLLKRLRRIEEDEVHERHERSQVHVLLLKTL